MNKIRWGILSTANIAAERLIPAIKKSPYAELAAVASRDHSKAQAFAQRHGIPKVEASYEALLQSPDVDAIYNPLPNHLHVPLSVQAVEAGKHVLCEKPLGLDAGDIAPLLNAADKNPALLVMEAFMYRFHPQWIKIRELIGEGVFGEIQAVQASFTYFNRDPANVRHQQNMGGGALLDIGCYCVSASRFIFGREPRSVAAHWDIDPDFKVDRHMGATLDFAPGTATFYVSTQSDSSQSVKIFGEKASALIENPFYSRGVPARIILRRDSDDEIIEIPDSDHYLDQINAFCRAALNGEAVPTPLADALANMKTLDALQKAAGSRRWESL